MADRFAHRFYRQRPGVVDAPVPDTTRQDALYALRAELEVLELYRKAPRRLEERIAEIKAGLRTLGAKPGGEGG